MKKTLLFIILVTVVASLFVGCSGKNQGELQFELNESGTEYTVSFTGRKNCADIIIPEEHEGLPVTGIADYAFRNYRKLKSITIPASITHIGKKAFIGCSGLESVHLSDLKAWCEITFDYNWLSFQSNPFYYADNLYVNGESVTNLMLPDDITEIKSIAFYGCKWLESVTIPRGIIGEAAFLDCRDLKVLNIGKGVTDIYPYAFENATALELIYFNAENMNDPACIQPNSFLYNYIFANAGEKGDGIKVVIGKDTTRIPERIFSSTDASSIISLEFEEGGVCKTIGAFAFEECIELQSVDIPSSVTAIENNAFSGCSSLSKLTISEGLTKIGYYSFFDCKNLNTVDLPNSLVSIYPYAFGNCVKLTNIKMPSKVIAFNADAFNGCYNIINIIFDENNPHFKSIDGNVYSKDGTTLVKFAPGKTDSEFTIPNGVATLGNYAFSGCRNLVSVTIPDSVTSIGDYAFHDCANLKSAVIGNSVTKIDNYAFAECIRLTSVTIPDSVTKIGNNAFKNCRRLRSITIPYSVTEIGANAFFGCERLVICCESTAIPAGWDASFNPGKRKVVLGCSGI